MTTTENTTNTPAIGSTIPAAFVAAAEQGKSAWQIELDALGLWEGK
jgi:hypothetical protein